MSKNPKMESGAGEAAADQTAAGKEVAGAESALDKEIAAMSLEQCFEELEQIVSALENQTTSLEDSINMFERGMKLSRRCNTELTRMERRIQLIVENSKQEVQYRDFESD